MYATKIVLTILSEEDVEGRDLGYLIESCDTGDCVLASIDLSKEELTGRQMAYALKNAGSDPGFFMLDDAGNRIDDYGNRTED